MPYGVEVRNVVVADARQHATGFEVTFASGDKVHGRKLVLATGVRDELPEIPGLAELYGTSVHHCPYCDGWEERDEPIAVYGKGDSGVKLALTLRMWSDDIILCTDGAANLGDAQARSLARQGIRVHEEPVDCLEGKDGRLSRILFRGGHSLRRSAMFLKSERVQRSDLAERLGCVVSAEKGILIGGKCEEAHVKGVFVAGDASEDILLAIVAASEGAKAAFGINCELQEEDQADEPITSSTRGIARREVSTWVPM